jgi:hypothetical protein
MLVIHEKRFDVGGIPAADSSHYNEIPVQMEEAWILASRLIRWKRSWNADSMKRLRNISKV